MTSLLDESPRCVMDVLRGERSTRPAPDTAAAAHLRAALEESLAELLGDDPREEPIIVRASSLRHDAPSNDSASPHAPVRGILVNQALRLLCAGAMIDDVYRDTLCAWRAEVGENYLTGYVDQLEGDDAARLRADVEAHWVTLKRSLGTLSNWWLPRTSLRAYQRLAGGSVILRDMVDLMVGTTSSEVASVVILDVTTSPLDEGAERVMRYHALVQTLRTGIVPLRTSMFSTGTGELWSVDVENELLSRSVAEVLGIIEGRA
ncbi:MAG: hypothetical protein ABSG58_01220 [Acidimicrobiales bacterium]|jgi:hypothetical protein